MAAFQVPVFSPDNGVFLRLLDLCEPAVGGEDLVLLVHVHDLVQRHAKLHDQRQAGVLHRADSLRQFVLKGQAHAELQYQRKAGVLRQFVLKGQAHTKLYYQRQAGVLHRADSLRQFELKGQANAELQYQRKAGVLRQFFCLKGTGSRQTPRSAAGWSSPQGEQPAANCVKGTGSRRTPRSAEGWSSTAICLKGTGSRRTPRSAAGWSSSQGGQPAREFVLKGQAHSERQDQWQAGVLHRADSLQRNLC
jgi:hypothetical protein